MATYGLKSITVGGNTYEMNTKNALSITLNGGSAISFDGGTANQSVSFYAPTTAGTSGYFLKSNGSGAPTWASVPAGVTVTLNGSTTTTPSFYAPTAAGTSGQVLTSSGSGAPTWAAAPSGAFIALYNNTTYNDIVAAYQAGKAISVRREVNQSDDQNLPLEGWYYDDGFFRFSGIVYDDTTIGYKSVQIIVNDLNSWTLIENIPTDQKLQVAQVTSGTSTSYGIILANGTSAATRQYDLTQKLDSNATNAGLKYVSKYLYTPGLYVGDLDYTITQSEYNTLMTALDAI